MLIGETGAFDPNLDPTGPGVRRPLSDVMQDRYKNEWISEVYDAAQLETEFPRLKGIMYFNVLKTEPKIETRNHWGGSAFLNVLADYRIPDDPNVYRQLISNPYFLGASSVLYYPKLTDTANVNSWRSYLVLQNPSGSDARAHLEIRSRDGAILYIGKQTIPRFGSIAIRPRDLVGTDCSGSVKAASDQHIQGTCQINRNNNEMCMEYNALDSGATTLYYPDFTNTANPDSWRSWLVVQESDLPGGKHPSGDRSRGSSPLLRIASNTGSLCGCYPSQEPCGIRLRRLGHNNLRPAPYWNLPDHQEQQ